MNIKNTQGYSLLEIIIAGLILTVVLIPLINLHVKINNLAGSAGKYNKAIFLAQSKIEEFKGVSYDRVLETPADTLLVFNEDVDYSYQVEVEEGKYGLKTVTVTVFYQEPGRENSVKFTAERRR